MMVIMKNKLMEANIKESRHSRNQIKYSNPLNVPIKDNRKTLERLLWINVHCNNISNQINLNSKHFKKIWGI